MPFQTSVNLVLTERSTNDKDAHRVHVASLVTSLVTSLVKLHQLFIHVSKPSTTNNTPKIFSKPLMQKMKGGHNFDSNAIFVTEEEVVQNLKWFLKQR